LGCTTTHKQVSQGWGKTCRHGNAAYLEVQLLVEF
jgi:hypothetical protein